MKTRESSAMKMRRKENETVKVQNSLNVKYRGVRHPFIVGFCGVCLHSTGLYIVTEFVDGGDVRSLLKTGMKWRVTLLHCRKQSR
jgi:serine/threonine protein kinase